jgi:hypothetical protein
VVTTIRAAAESAAAATRAGWRERAEGAALLDALNERSAGPGGRALPGFGHRPPASLVDRAMAAVADWRAHAAGLVADQVGGPAPVSKLSPAAADSVALLLTVVALSAGAPGERAPAGAAEAATTASSVESGRFVLDMLFSRAVAARLVDTVREDLRSRAGVLLAEECARFTGALAALDLPADDASVLHSALDGVQRARARAT